MRDIEYFSESRMTDKRYGAFRDSLPSRLQNTFRDSGPNTLMDSKVYGYRGPSTSYGVQEIQFWYGVNPDMNFIPVVGWIGYGIARAVESSNGNEDWRTMYFDESSGDVLSSWDAHNRRNKNQEAEEHQNRGVNYYNRKDYENAYKEFQQAYAKCSSGYKNEQIFKTNKKNSQNLWAKSYYSEGINLFNQSNYKAAADKFRLAYDKVDDDAKKRDYQNDIGHAEAAALLMEGNSLRGQGRFDEAIQKYQAGINTCPSAHESTKNTIKNSMNEAVKLWANSYYNEGLKLFNQSNYRSAADKFRLALNKTTDADKKRDYQNDIDHSEAWALNADGHDVYNQGKYSEAVQKYQSAYYRCPSVHKSSETTFKNNMNGASNLWANSYYNEGLKLFNQSSYKSAAEKFRLALDKTTDASKKRDYQNDIDHSEASALNADGIVLYNQGKYSEAVQKYQAAIDRCPLSHKESENIFRNNMAESLNSHGSQLFNGGDYNAAKEKFQLAKDKSLNDSKKATYTNNINLAQAEIQNIEAQSSINSGDYDSAISKCRAAKLNVARGSTMTKIDRTLAKALSKKAQQIWNAAWKAEENDNANDAKAKFSNANEMFQEASQLDSTNSEYRKLTQISALKIEGNQFFNQGVELQEQANQLKKKRKFQEARNKYQEAKDKFQRGYDLSGNDSRFKTCLDITQEYIDEVNEMIKNMSLNAGETVGEENDETNGEEEQTIGTIGTFKNWRG
jgi:tetratricopeptide (TPR) repeat protein